MAGRVGRSTPHPSTLPPVRSGPPLSGLRVGQRLVSGNLSRPSPWLLIWGGSGARPMGGGVDPFRWPGVRGRQRRLGFPGPCRATLYPREDGSESSLEGWGISLGCTFFRRTSIPLPRPGRSGNSPWRNL